MKELETRIIQDGKIINNEILKIDSFINHQIDVNLLNNISKYLASHFDNITKILTIETSGIAFAIGVSQCLGNIPVVFAKKTKSKIVDEKNIYTARVHSFTKNVDNVISVDKRFLSKEDNVLIVDDFLAEGNAAFGLIDLCHQANCKIAGVSVVVEKRFQGGRDRIEHAGIKVVSAASIDHFGNNTVVFYNEK